MAVADRFRLHHVCLEVADIRRTAERLERTFGFGPFELREHIAFTDLVAGDGRKIDWDHSNAFGAAGPILIELHTTHSIAPEVVREGLSQRPISHLGYVVDDLDEARDSVLAEGGREILRAANDAVELAYFAMPEVGIVELLKLNGIPGPEGDKERR